jgi:hypothetical protein
VVKYVIVFVLQEWVKPDDMTGAISANSLFKRKQVMPKFNSTKKHGQNDK